MLVQAVQCVWQSVYVGTGCTVCLIVCACWYSLHSVPVFLCNLLSLALPNIAPLHCILSLSQLFISEQQEVPLEAVTYLVGECNYGGHVTDDWDRRTLNTLLRDFINKRLITDDNYVFSTTGKLYDLPAQHEYRHYIQHIQVWQLMVHIMHMWLSLHCIILYHYIVSLYCIIILYHQLHCYIII